MFIQHKIRPCFTWLPVLVLLLFLGLTGPSPALAHKVYLFAWVEGDTVLVDAYFSKSKRVMGGKIEVMDSTGQKLLEGTTDDKGRFSFKIPKKDDLFIYAEPAWAINRIPHQGGRASGHGRDPGRRIGRTGNGQRASKPRPNPRRIKKRPVKSKRPPSTKPN